MKITVDVRGLEAIKKSLSNLSVNLQAKAMSAALNKTAAKAAVELNRAVRAEFNISANEVRNSIDIGKTSAKSASSLSATIRIFGSAKRKGRSLNVIHFLEKSISMAQARKRAKKGTLFVQTQKGRLLPILGFKFKKGAGVKSIEGAFVGNKGRTVFVRTGNARLPIEPVQMIGVSQMFSTEKIKKRVMEKIDRDVVVEMDRAVKMIMNRFGK